MSKNANDQFDRLYDRAAQLQALCHSMSDGFDSFKELEDLSKHNLLWLAASLSDEIRDLVDEL
jgi:hypothetical protein